MNDLAAPRPGRFGDADLAPENDPRIDRNLRAVLSALQMGGQAEPPPFDRSVGTEAIAQFAGALDEGFNALYDNLPGDLPGDEDIEPTLETITGVDGNDIRVWVFRPADMDGPTPAVVYYHGGGMAILRTDAPVHVRWCQALAAAGVISVLADFRNSWTAEGLNPFPAGLDDCGSVLDWVHANRDTLGISSIVVQGESGGGNLALATALKAKREGRLDAIAGVYASVPFVSGSYHRSAEWRAANLPSSIENDQQFIGFGMLDMLAALYTPEHDQDNPLAWPLFATTQDLQGLPPHVITVNELDPLRDEGIAYYRKLLEAGVPTVGKMNLGVVHGAELVFRQALPGLNRSAINDIASFARSV